MPLSMLAFISNLSPGEIVLILALAIIIFGRRLPQVVMEAGKHLAKARRALTQLREETGIDRELREVRRTLDDVSATVKAPVGKQAISPRIPTPPTPTGAEAPAAPTSAGSTTPEPTTVETAPPGAEAEEADAVATGSEVPEDAETPSDDSERPDWYPRLDSGAVPPRAPADPAEEG